MSNTAIVATPTMTLLAAGVVAGPIYVVVGLAEAFTREGFDLTRHSLSLLASGRLGWIHSALLVTTGVLTIAGALGLRRDSAADLAGLGGQSCSDSTVPAWLSQVSLSPTLPKASRPGRLTGRPRLPAGTASATWSPGVWDSCV
jgi:Protein of unknown function (DUF998)